MAISWELQLLPLLVKYHQQCFCLPRFVSAGTWTDNGINCNIAGVLSYTFVCWWKTKWKRLCYNWKSTTRIMNVELSPLCQPRQGFDTCSCDSFLWIYTYISRTHLLHCMVYCEHVCLPLQLPSGTQYTAPYGAMCWLQKLLSRDGLASSSSSSF